MYIYLFFSPTEPPLPFVNQHLTPTRYLLCQNNTRSYHLRIMREKEEQHDENEEPGSWNKVVWLFDEHDENYKEGNRCGNGGSEYSGNYELSFNFWVPVN